MAKDKGYEVVDAESPAQEVEVVDAGALAILNKSEINQQIATAKEYPRSIKKFRNEAMSLATLNEKIAEECMYAIPRGGKTIEGPSARFAEIIAYCWGNMRILGRCIKEDEKSVTGQGIAFDLERNVIRVRESERRITNKYGKRYDDDMIGVTKNAAISVAERNATLAVIPKAIWVDIYSSSREAAIGTVETLANKRAAMVAHFQKFGVSPEMICTTLGVESIDNVGLDELAQLKGIAQAIKEGDITPENAFQVPEKKSGKGMEGLKDLLGGKKEEPKVQYAVVDPEKVEAKEKEEPKKEEPKEEPKKEEPKKEPPKKREPPKGDPPRFDSAIQIQTVIDKILKVTAGDQLDNVVRDNLSFIQGLSQSDRAKITEAYQAKFAELNP